MATPYWGCLQTPPDTVYARALTDVYPTAHHVYMSDLEPEETEEDLADASSTSAAATVSVEGAGVSITRQVDDATMSAVIALLFGNPVATRPATIAGTGSAVTGSSRTPRPQSATQWDDDLTLGEFIEEVEAKTFPQKICAAGYYLITMQGAESFSRDGVKAALAGAHEDMPANFSRDWGVAASSHLVAAKQDDANQFYVPRTGRLAVESKFSGVPKRRATRRAPKKAAGSAANGDAG